MRDLNLRKDVLKELEYEPSIDSAHIGVAVENGIVTLSGHVGSYAEKIAAENAVRRVKGVAAIAQDIEVRFPEDKKTADDEIAQRALSILRWDVTVPKDGIVVKVDNGWITLTGSVDWHFQKRTAEAAVRKLSGVRGVENLLTIRSRASTADIRHSIEEALKRRAQVEANRIQVTVDGGVVTLEGDVRDWSEKLAVERVAWAAPGVISVTDHLKVQ